MAPKDEPEEIESLPASAEKVVMPEVIERRVQDLDIDVSDPAFALFADQPSSKPAAVDPEECIFGGIELEKAFGRLELVDAEDPSETQEVTIWLGLELLCSIK